MQGWSFAKGHGTQNDFVLLIDPDDELPFGEPEVRWLCDRRAGIGGDGVLRAVRSRHIRAWDGPGDLWFMDYRNADGSVAEMCGNGIRVFVRHLAEQSLISGPEVCVATRAGLRSVRLLPDGRVRADLGPVVVGAERVRVATADGSVLDAVRVDVGNPHAVSFVEDLDRLALDRPPTLQPQETFPEGANCEFVEPVAERWLAMRVHERGSGETRSCGTGTVAAAAAWRARAGAAEEPGPYRVDVPGGRLEVELGERAYLTGPAVIVAHGVVAVPPR